MFSKNELDSRSGRTWNISIRSPSTKPLQSSILESLSNRRHDSWSILPTPRMTLRILASSLDKNCHCFSGKIATKQIHQYSRNTIKLLLLTEANISGNTAHQECPRRSDGRLDVDIHYEVALDNRVDMLSDVVVAGRKELLPIFFIWRLGVLNDSSVYDSSSFE